MAKSRCNAKVHFINSDGNSIEMSGDVYDIVELPDGESEWTKSIESFEVTMSGTIGDGVAKQLLKMAFWPYMPWTPFSWN